MSTKECQKVTATRIRIYGREQVKEEGRTLRTGESGRIHIGVKTVHQKNQ